MERRSALFGAQIYYFFNELRTFTRDLSFLTANKRLGAQQVREIYHLRTTLWRNSEKNALIRNEG